MLMIFCVGSLGCTGDGYMLAMACVNFIVAANAVSWCRWLIMRVGLLLQLG